MEIINIPGLIFMAVIMVPNIIFAAKNKDGFKNDYANKAAEILEQIGRFGCFVFMIFVIPGLKFGFSSAKSFAAYSIVNSVLTLIYCIIWVIYFRKNCVFRAIALSVIPSLIFLLSGMLTGYLPLILSAALFAPCHILISYKNAALEKARPSNKNAYDK